MSDVSEDDGSTLLSANTESDRLSKCSQKHLHRPCFNNFVTSNIEKQLHVYRCESVQSFSKKQCVVHTRTI